MKIYLIKVHIPAALYQVKYNYLFKGSGKESSNVNRFHFLEDKDVYAGLYAWSNNKTEISEFLEFRNLSRVKYHKEIIEIDKDDFDEFRSKYKFSFLKKYEIPSIKGDVQYMLMTYEEYLNVTEYASENLFEFVDADLYKADYYVLKGKYMQALDIISYTTNYDNRSNMIFPFNDERYEFSDYMMTYGLTTGGNRYTINYYESTMTVFYLLFREMLC